MKYNLVTSTSTTVASWCHLIRSWQVCNSNTHYPALSTWPPTMPIQAVGNALRWTLLRRVIIRTRNQQWNRCALVGGKVQRSQTLFLGPPARPRHPLENTLTVLTAAALDQIPYKRHGLKGHTRHYWTLRCKTKASSLADHTTFVISQQPSAKAPSGKKVNQSFVVPSCQPNTMVWVGTSQIKITLLCGESSKPTFPSYAYHNQKHGRFF